MNDACSSRNAMAGCAADIKVMTASKAMMSFLAVTGAIFCVAAMVMTG